MARPNIEKRGPKTPTSKTTSRVAKPSVPRITRSETLRRTAIAQHNSNSPLLRLPAEIRNQLYDYVIGGQTYVLHKGYETDTPYYLTRKDYIGFHWYEQTALPRTCRQFRHDTSVLSFQNNIFMADYSRFPSTLNNWMRSLQPYHASAIQTILWGLWGLRSNPEALKLLLADWMGIKRVGIYYSHSDQSVANQEVLEIAGFELDGTVEDKGFGLSVMWYERS